MAFRWNKESLAVLRENAGVLTTEQIAGMLRAQYGVSTETQPAGIRLQSKTY